MKTEDKGRLVRRSPPTQMSILRSTAKDELVRRAGLGEVGRTEDRGQKTEDRGQKTENGRRLALPSFDHAQDRPVGRAFLFETCGIG